jgi:DNA-directed RNA polymerase subunit RPC12/RpoP
MPIRFRCAYCNQLLGIAHRKAGRVVRCPTCSGQVVVPNPDPERDEAEDVAAVNPNLFEASDIDEVLAMPQPVLAAPGAAPARPAPPDGAWGTHGEPAYVPPRPVLPPPAPPPPSAPPPAPAVMAPPQPPGLFLSPTRATLLVVGGILSLAAAFGAGLLVGKFMLH